MAHAAREAKRDARYFGQFTRDPRAPATAKVAASPLAAATPPPSVIAVPPPPAIDVDHELGVALQRATAAGAWAAVEAIVREIGKRREAREREELVPK